MQLETARLLLRELAESDADAMSSWESLPDVVRYTPADCRTRDETLAYLRDGITLAAIDPRMVFDLAVVERASGRMIGRTGFGRNPREPREAALWYVLHPSASRRGLALEAARAMVGFAFERVAIHRIYADIDPRNLPSVRLAERLGMRREAHLVENFWCKGEWTDSVYYALLAREWPLVARLQP